MWPLACFLDELIVVSDGSDGSHHPRTTKFVSDVKASVLLFISRSSIEAWRIRNAGESVTLEESVKFSHYFL